MVWDVDIEIVKDEKSRILLAHAYNIAWCFSEDPVTKTGAAIYDDEKCLFLAGGANHFPEGLNPTPEQLADRDWKLEHIIHAEPSAVHKAAKYGRATAGATMYMPWVPCVPCAKVIKDAGIKTLIGHKEMIEQTPERWWKDCGKAINLLKECGVNLYMYEGKIGDVESLFNGNIWYP